jgi:hypothetical protein
VKGWVIPVAVVAAAFVLTRLPALELREEDNDVTIYARYASEWLAAAHHGVSFYDLHQHLAEEKLARMAPEWAAEHRDSTTIEYPPLAVAVMAWVALPVHDPFGGEYIGTTLPVAYARAFTVVLVGCDLAVLLLVAGLVRRLYPAGSPWETGERCLAYVVCSWPLAGLLYTRLDLPLALLILASLALLVSRRPWWMAVLVLALGIHLKLMPVVLAPLWIVAALPADALRGPWRSLARLLAGRAAVLGGFVAAILVVFYVRLGPRSLDFLAYHRERGLEIGSTWTSLLLLLRPFGFDVETYFGHGSYNVRAPLAPMLAAAATLTTAALLLAGWALFFAAARRSGPNVPADAGATVAQTRPRLLAAFTLLLLLFSVVANKVFSPQYLLWIVPLVPLVDGSPWVRRALFAAMLLVAFETRCIYPVFFFTDIVVRSREDVLPVIGNPTAFGTCLLVARNVTFVALTAAFAWLTLRQGRAAGCGQVGGAAAAGESAAGDCPAT